MNNTRSSVFFLFLASVACDAPLGDANGDSQNPQPLVLYPCDDSSPCVVVEDNCGCDNYDGKKVAIPESDVETFPFAGACNNGVNTQPPHNATCNASGAVCEDGLCVLTYD